MSKDIVEQPPLYTRMMTSSVNTHGAEQFACVLFADHFGRWPVVVQNQTLELTTEQDDLPLVGVFDDACFKQDPSYKLLYSFIAKDWKGKVNSENVFSLYKNSVVMVVKDDDGLNIQVLGLEQPPVEAVMAEVLAIAPKFKSDDSTSMYLLSSNSYGIDLAHVNLPKRELDLESHYAPEFLEVHGRIAGALTTLGTSGLVMLYGDPGTGKSSYIRHLATIFPKRTFIYVPQNMTASLSNPELIPVLVGHKNVVLLIEDAEDALIPDAAGGRASATSVLLNLSDGILGAAMSCIIITTVNQSPDKIDPALRRPGRLIAEFKFSRLSPTKATELSAKLGSAKVWTEPTSLGEIYASYDPRGTVETPKPKIGFGF